MTSPEQEPNHEVNYNFPWQYDNEFYLGVKTEYGNIEMRQSNTELYLFPEHPDIDHIYIMQEVLDDETSRGYRLFRGHCDRIGPGAFSAMVDQMIEHGFDIAEDEEPSELDIQAWQEAFNKEYNPIDKLVQLAMKNFESEWIYYQDEEGWGGKGDLDR